jgi:hypothetical protein
MKIFGREPAVVLAIFSALLQALAAFGLNLSPELQGAATAVIAAVFGAWTAFSVAQDKVLPALLGLAQAGFALLLSLGLDVPTTTQVAVSTLVTAVVAAFVRTQVVAPAAR